MELTLETWATGVRDHVFAHDHGVAAEALCLFFADRDQIVDQFWKNALALLVKRFWIVDRCAESKWAETRIEVVVEWVDQFDRNDTTLQDGPDLLMAPRVTPDSIPGVQGIAAKQGIAGAFKENILG